MKTTETIAKTQGNFARATALFGLCALVLSLTQLGRFFMFPYERLAVVDANHKWHYLLSSSQGTCLNVLQWGIAAILFGWLARKVRFRFLFPLTLVAMLLVTVLMNCGVKMLGMGFYWDLWH